MRHAWGKLPRTSKFESSLTESGGGSYSFLKERVNALIRVFIENDGKVNGHITYCKKRGI